MVKLLKRGKKDDQSEPASGPEANAAPSESEAAAAPAESATTEMPTPEAPAAETAGAETTAAGPQAAAEYEPTVSAEPAPWSPPAGNGNGNANGGPRLPGLLGRVYGEPGEQSAAERDRVAAMEFEQAISPVLDLMRASVPEASTPEEAERILAANQGEITPDPKGGAYVQGDAFDADARVYYRLLRRDYEKNPRPSEKRGVSHHLHGVYGKLTGTKGW